MTALCFWFLSGYTDKNQQKVNEVSLKNVKKEDAIQSAVTSETTALAPPKTALVIDDNVLDQKIIKTRLKGFGVISETASNSDEAIKKLSEKNFDVLLMDMPMSDNNLIKTAEDIAACILPAETQMIAMIPGMTVSDKEKCLAVGMDACLPKPIRKEDLQQLLSR